MTDPVEAVDLPITPAMIEAGVAECHKPHLYRTTGELIEAILRAALADTTTTLPADAAARKKARDELTAEAQKLGLYGATKP